MAALDRITRTFGPTLANDGVSLSVLPGEVIGLIGANGAGKSTLMRILCGVTEPDSGTLALAGAPVAFHDWSPAAARRRGIRIVYQELSLCTNLTVAENFYLEDRPEAPPPPSGAPATAGLPVTASRRCSPAAGSMPMRAWKTFPSASARWSRSPAPPATRT